MTRGWGFWTISGMSDSAGIRMFFCGDCRDVEVGIEGEVGDDEGTRGRGCGMYRWFDRDNFDKLHLFRT